MEFKVWSAFVAGVVAGASMIVMRMLLQLAGFDLTFDVARLWGTMVQVHGNGGYLLGMLIHLVGSGAIGVIFAWIFARIGAAKHLWGWGLLGGAILWVIAGVFMAVVPVMHPEIPKQRPSPGAFLMNFGTPDVLTFLMGHLLYGLIVGILYASFQRIGRTGIVI